MAAALAHLQFPHIYPDPESRTLRAALAADCGVPAENLLVGAKRTAFLTPLFSCLPAQAAARTS